MPLQSRALKLKKPLRLDDEVRFLRSWIEKPLHMGAVMPSSRLLARTMAQYVDIHSTGPVVELGPGTGAISALVIAPVPGPSSTTGPLELTSTYCAMVRASTLLDGITAPM